ncbi:LacI family DNA-binding transcriptional regulator [Leifsonia shinshuensis]|uniref:LacI family DNA-binding transcriptional regulator n=1 Tax=Leifsonia shinshuensis TaxID=150026 RepID=UPI00285CAF5C|nr:LacI family DNA-binding transcriptional regulator [Leifsonia shinshuensis]MDR6971665.1 LacI family transcriptional regulator [Leifsonia shinshuensis]
MPQVDPLPHLARRVTSIDVAKAAGCSQAAVSLWVTGKHEGRLSDELQKRIAKAVADLGYVPNRTARRLTAGSSRSVSFIFPGFSYHFFGSILEGVGGVLDDAWELTFHDSRPGRAHPDRPNVVSSSVFADTTGVILASPSAAEVEAIGKVGAAAVLVDSPEAPPGTSRVSFELVESLREVAEDLHRLGHRRVGYVSFVANSLTLASRRAAVVSAFKARGLKVVGPDLRLESLDMGAIAERFAQKWPDWRAAGVTAVLCADDRHAFGVIRAARGMNLRIPDDFSLVAFNDTDAAAIVDPALSSIRLPSVAIGAAAGQALKDLVTEGNAREIAVATQYIPRTSTGMTPAE